MDLYVVPTWKNPAVDPMAALPVSYSILLQSVLSDWCISLQNHFFEMPRVTSGTGTWSKLIILPAWSRQPEKQDHYMLCVSVVQILSTVMNNILHCLCGTFIFLSFIINCFLHVTSFGNVWQVLKPAEREILFLDSLKPDGFGDSCYLQIFRFCNILTFSPVLWLIVQYGNSMLGILKDS